MLLWLLVINPMTTDTVAMDLASEAADLPDDLKAIYVEVEKNPRSFDTWVQLLTAAESTVCPQTYPTFFLERCT